MGCDGLTSSDSFTFSSSTDRIDSLNFRAYSFSYGYTTSSLNNGVTSSCVATSLFRYVSSRKSFLSTSTSASSCSDTSVFHSLRNGYCSVSDHNNVKAHRMSCSKNGSLDRFMAVSRCLIANKCFQPGIYLSTSCAGVRCLVGCYGSHSRQNSFQPGSETGTTVIQASPLRYRESWNAYHLHLARVCNGV